MTTMTMADLKGMAVAISKPTKIYVGGLANKFETYEPDVEEFDMRYNINAGIVTFISEKTQFVIPNFVGTEKTLRLNGYTPNHALFVPFTQGGYPVNKEEYWRKIKISCIGF
ncbi:MAG: hypothetical protein E7311_00175 [Clostridiales bacterium]|nr:hypothetical protein [Clostridiales bacterium]